jgi:DNA-nicking Smr family endonuclease
VLDHDQTDDAMDDPAGGAPQPMALDGVLDLHMFPPSEARALVDDWLDASREAGLRDLRIIHGKGIGALRTLVHAALDARGDIESYTLAADASSWGATVIRMKP